MEERNLPSTCPRTESTRPTGVRSCGGRVDTIRVRLLLYRIASHNYILVGPSLKLYALATKVPTFRVTRRLAP